MGFTALDYSSAISGADLAAATVDGIWKISTVFRYITDPSWPKSLQAEEYADLIAHGFRVFLLDEGTADYMVNGSYAGFAGGRTRAQERRARANQIGAGGPIFYSLDIGATQDQIDVALEFLAGAAAADPGGVGAYGEYNFVRQAADSGYPILGTEGWSGGQRDPRAIGWQMARQIDIAGVTCDLIDLNPQQPTPPNSTQEDDDMPAFSEGQLRDGDGAVTVICVPPANYGSAGWGNVWFSLASDFEDADVRVAIYTHGAGWSEIDQDIHVTAAGDRVNPHGGPLPTAVQKISVRRVTNTSTPMGYLIEAAHR
jgi:hypothetical protein